jgi:hydrogenase maturation protease
MNQSASRVLIAGVGNVLYGDDAFGCEVASRLAKHALPKNVRVVDFGIRGFDLVTALLDPYDLVIIVDTLSQGGQPGALRVFDSLRDLIVDSAPPNFRAGWHALDPATALAMSRALGGGPGRVILVGCEQDRSDEPAAPHMGMSDSVLAAVDRAVPLILSLVAQHRAELSAR